MLTHFVCAHHPDPLRDVGEGNKILLLFNTKHNDPVMVRFGDS